MLHRVGLVKASLAHPAELLRLLEAGTFDDLIGTPLEESMRECPCGHSEQQHAAVAALPPLWKVLRSVSGDPSLALARIGRRVAAGIVTGRGTSSAACPSLGWLLEGCAMACTSKGCKCAEAAADAIVEALQRLEGASLLSAIMQLNDSVSARDGVVSFDDVMEQGVGPARAAMLRTHAFVQADAKSWEYASRYRHPRRSVEVTAAPPEAPPVRGASLGPTLPALAPYASGGATAAARIPISRAGDSAGSVGEPAMGREGEAAATLPSAPDGVETWFSRVAWTHQALDRRLLRPALVLCDIDDTAMPTLKDHGFPSQGALWADKAYPGCAAFLKGLRRGHQGAAVGGRVVFATARPLLLRQLSTRQVHRAELGPGTVMPGTLLNMLAGASSHAPKVAATVRAISNSPCSRVVLIGDTGQADPAWHRELMAGPARPFIHAALVHDVKGWWSQAGATSLEARRASVSTGGPYVFDGYVEAALVAWQLGALSLRSLVRVLGESSAWFSDMLRPLLGEEAASREACSSLAAVLRGWSREEREAEPVVAAAASTASDGGFLTAPAGPGEKVSTAAREAVPRAPGSAAMVRQESCADTPGPGPSAAAARCASVDQHAKESSVAGDRAWSGSMRPLSWRELRASYWEGQRPLAGIADGSLPAMSAAAEVAATAEWVLGMASVAESECADILGGGDASLAVLCFCSGSAGADFRKVPPWLRARCAEFQAAVARTLVALCQVSEDR